MITDEIDFVSLHTYPMLDTWFDPDPLGLEATDVPESQRAGAMMDAAIAETKRQYQEARGHLDRKGLSYMPDRHRRDRLERGRPRAASAFRAHPVNQKMYFDR